jgi:type IV secretory pathway TrbD component
MIRTMRRLGPGGLRTAIWAAWTCHRVHRQLARGGMDEVRLSAPPPLSGHDREVVLAVMRRVGATCLERSLVLQRWYAAQRTSRVLIIGVTAPRLGFRAHAWLDGETDAPHHEMVEILRRPPPAEWLTTVRQSR